MAMPSDQSNAYYSDVAFASQLCSEFAHAESNLELSAALAQAHTALQLILAHNTADPPTPPSDRQPAWPLHDALIRFDVPLHRLTTHFLLAQKWKPRFVILRGSRLYYSNGKNGNAADSHEGALAFLRSNPDIDGHYCVSLKGTHARRMLAVFCCSAS